MRQQSSRKPLLLQPEAVNDLNYSPGCSRNMLCSVALAPCCATYLSVTYVLVAKMLENTYYGYIYIYIYVYVNR